MTIDKYANVPDSLLSQVLLMDAGLARLVQKQCEEMGLFTKTSFLEAREQLIGYSENLEEEEDDDDMLEDNGRRTHFTDRLKIKIKEYISQFSEEERRILINAGYEKNPTGSHTVRNLMHACGYKD